MKKDTNNTYIVENMSYAEQLTKKFIHSHPWIDSHFEELRSESYIALCHAASMFDETLGISFRTFASKRIIGSLYDYLRKADLRTRNARRAAAVVVAGASIEDAAKAFNMTANEVMSAVNFGITSLETMLEYDEEPISEEDAYAKLEQSLDLYSAIDNLPNRQKSVIDSFLKGNSLKTWAANNGVSAAYASQLYSAAVKNLRRQLVA